MKKYMLVALLSLMINASCLIASESIDNFVWRRAGFITKERVKELLDSGADVNAADGGGSTVLMAAAFSGSKESVELLLEYGANVNAANNWEWTVLMYAAMGDKCQEVTELLLKKVQM